MSDRRTALRRLWPLIGALMLLALIVAGSAQADPYGALARFADKGELEAPEAAFGVDTSDNSVYVVDKPDEGKKGLRIQKLEESPTTKKYEVVASASFNPKGTSENEVEGVAVDPKAGRVYVLAEDERPAQKIDPEEEAASQLYSFETKQIGSKLEAAPGTVEEGVLTGTKELEPSSSKAGVSLIEPGGITVDPVNDDIIIAAREDRGKLAPAEEDTPVLQAIHANGELGARYVDETEFFEEETINSPVVAASGKVYVLSGRDEIDEIPTENGNFLNAPAKHIFRFECEEEEGCTGFKEPLTEFPGDESESGAQMSIGAEGDIYVRARIRLAEEEEERDGGVLVFSPTLVEQGWTGGGSPIKVKTEECSVRERGGGRPVLAAGNERVFMLSRTEFEAGKVSPSIVEFGPNGKGCPKTEATVPSAKAGGVEVEPVPIADKVTFSSQVTQGNALSVEWEFGDGSATQTVSTRAPEVSEEIAGGHLRVYAVSSVEHKFLKGGKLTVKEKIHTDNFASPLIEVQRSIEIVGAPGVRAEEATVKGTAVTLAGEVNSFGKELAECEFEYGKASEGFPTKVPCASKPTGEEFQHLSVEVNGLVKLTEYHFRISAKNSSGEQTQGKGTSFKTEEPVPVVTTGAATVSGETAAMLNGTVNPEGETIKCKFQYGTSISYGSEAPCSTTPEGQTAAPVSAALTGLAPGGHYHFRLVVEAAGKSYSGKDAIFQTTSPVLTIPLPEEQPPVKKSGEGQTPPPPPPIVPVVTIAGSGISVSSAGAFGLKLSCPANAGSCTVAVTVRTASAVAASTGHIAKAKKAILTLASGSVTVAGGQTKALTLHLSAKARKLLAHLHVLRAKVTIVAHDPSGGSNTTTSTITLRLAKKRAHH